MEAVYSGSNLQAKYLRGAVIDEVVNGYQFDANGKWTNATFHHDPLQSVVGLSGHNGEVLNLASYGPFGETTGESGNVSNFLKYTGREKDPDTGLYQVRARYYDPETGTFISMDPIGFAGGINQYLYCGADPLNCSDPMGLSPLTGGAKAWFISKFGHLITDAHHMVPTQVLKDLPPEVANNPAVRGVAGAPNKWPIPRSLHQQIHNTAEIGGERYNIAFQNSVDKIRAERAITPADVVSIRNDMAKTYGLDKYRPYGGASSTLRDMGSALVGGIAVGLEVLEAIDPWTYMLDIPGAGKGSDIVAPTGNVSWQEVYDNGSPAGGAAGGFLLYPNKANTNMMRSVYSK